MLSNSAARRLSLGVIALAGCGGNSAPQGWLPKPMEAQAAAYGGWIELTYTEGDRKHKADGELIAVSQDSVWVLSQSDALVVGTAAVEQGKLTAYAAETGGLVTWMTLGALSTLSNGLLLIFTAPLWVIVGGSSVAAEAGVPQRRSPPLAWTDLAQFARFPQGMPAGVTFAGLQPKPGWLPNNIQ